MKTRLFITAVIALLMWGCSSRPDKVLSHNEMVSLMVDIHEGEAYVESHYNEFMTDSTKMVMRQSVLREHGVTAEQFDSSLMWYGKNTEELTEMYGEVIEKLETEMNLIDAYSTSTSFAGDSVNAWTESPFYVLNRRSPSSLLKFTLPSDENWQAGDSYTWQFKTLNQRSKAKMAMFLDYDDGTTEIITNEFNHDGWQRLTIVADSLRNPVNVYGYTNFELPANDNIYLDSVSLVRKRLQPDLYRQRYRQRSFKYGSKNTPVNESSAFARADSRL